MPAPGALDRSFYGPGSDDMLRSMNAGGTAYAMAALNTGWCARFTALDTRDVKAVTINWTAAATPGVVTVRIETIDATTGKPSGNLYDASATVTIVPAAGTQVATFAVLPTTGLVAGNEYGIVLLTTTAGTTQTLRSYGSTPGALPTVVLTAADGTTRSNFAMVGFSAPMVTITFEDDIEEAMDFCPYLLGSATTTGIHGTRAEGMKFVIPTGITLAAAGAMFNLGRVGTPAGDLRLRIFSDSSAVSGATFTIDKDSMTGSSNLGNRRRFAAPVSLAAGTYRAVFDSAASANSSNCFRFAALRTHNSAVLGSAFALTSTTDVTAGTITWVDEADKHPGFAIMESALSAAGGGAVYHGAMAGGMLV